jgi:hypothetical protein
MPDPKTIRPDPVPSSAVVGTPTVTAIPPPQTIHPIGIASSEEVAMPIVTIVGAAVAVAEAVEKSSPAEWPVLLAFAKDLVEEVLELAATGALDVNSAGGQMLLAVLICGVLQTLTVLMSRRPPP